MLYNEVAKLESIKFLILSELPEVCIKCKINFNDALKRTILSCGTISFSSSYNNKINIKILNLTI